VKNSWRGAATALIRSYSEGFFFSFSSLFLMKVIPAYSHHLRSSPRYCRLVSQARLIASNICSTFLLLTVILFPFCTLLTFSPRTMGSQARFLPHLLEITLINHHPHSFSPFPAAGREGMDVPIAPRRRSPLTWSEGLFSIALGACVLYGSLISCHC